MKLQYRKLSTLVFVRSVDWFRKCYWGCFCMPVGICSERYQRSMNSGET
jgi:hypothetical protein